MWTHAPWRSRCCRAGFGGSSEASDTSQVYSARVSDPAAYLITFRCYGTWLHGDARGSVDRGHRGYGEPPAPPNPLREQYARRRMTGPPQTLDPHQRTVVEGAIREVAAVRGWHISALAVRSNHVHIVVTAQRHSAERVMNDFKAYATRALRRAQLVGPDQRIWSHHGSTKLLWNDDDVRRACAYVAEGQGRPLR